MEQSAASGRQATVPVELFDRHYKSPAVRWAVGAAFAVGLLALALLVSERAAALFVVIAVAGGVFAIWQGSAALRNGGVREGPDAMTNRRFTAYVHWRWRDIERFDHVGSRVYVVPRTGRAIPLIGIAQGYRVTWRGGQTRDVAGLLNERLDLWRAQHEEAVARSL